VLLRRALDASNDERRRIAGHLHDGVVQDLAGVSYSLAAAAQTSPAARTDPALRSTLDEAAEVTRASMHRLRSLLVAIHPPNLRAAGLEAALRDLVATLERRGIETELDVDGPLELTAETEALIFRAAREATRNVSTHAEATHVHVRVEARDGYARLTIEDNGTGFDEEELERRRQKGHLGLSLLEELAAHEDAFMDIQSEPGRGTTFVLEVAKP
jgi:signal transduction histidine kinase